MKRTLYAVGLVLAAFLFLSMRADGRQPMPFKFHSVAAFATCPTEAHFKRHDLFIYRGLKPVVRSQRQQLGRWEKCAISDRVRETEIVFALATRTAWLARQLQRTVEPYQGWMGGDGWPVYYGRSAVPICIVNAESHGLLHEHSDPDGSSGKYQIELATWDAEGGTRYAAYPYEASDLDQSIVAARIWADGRGAGNWTTAAGCGYD